MFPYRPPAVARAAPWRHSGLGQANVVEEAKRVAPEFKEAGNWFLATAGFVGGDFLLHQLLPNTAAEKTPPYYYSNKLIWTIPGLLLGRLLSDYVVKGSDFVRALTIGTVANAVLAVRYLKNYPPGYIATVGTMHELLLVPLSFLITGPSPVTGFFEKKG